MRAIRPIEDLLQDVRFGARLLARSPMFSIVAILSLAIGIGANSAIFSLVNAIVLRQLPVERPQELHIAQVSQLEQFSTRFSWPAYESLRTLIGGRAEMTAASSVSQMQVAPRNLDITRAGSPERSGRAADAASSGASASATPKAESAQVQLISGDYFSLLRQQPQRGRLLGLDDNRTLGGHPVAVITDGYWSRTFGRSPSALGSELIINGVPFTIVGVTSPTFLGTSVAGRTVDIWVPIMMQSAVRYAGNASNSNGDDTKPWPPQREISWLNIVLRIAPDSVEAVTQALNLGMQREFSQMSGFDNDADFRRRLQQSRVTLQSGSRGFSRVRDDMTTPLIVLLVMVGLLLAIACANIASLLLARATNRHREMAIRLSAGARRGRLIRQLLTESLLLAVLGGGLGLLIAQWGSAALLAVAARSAAGRSPMTGIDISPDWRVVIFTFAVSVITGLLFGLMPALRSTRVSLAETLKAQTRSVISSGARNGGIPLARVLIAGQMAFSLLLLIAAALFARSLQQLARVDIGFDRDHVFIARMDPRAAGYEATELPELYRRLVERVRAVPGVTSASASLSGPFSGSRRMSGFEAEGYSHGPDERMVTMEEYVTTDYFRTVGLTIMQGRAFGPEDLAKNRRVSIINETMAKRYFRGQNPIGKRWSFDTDFGPKAFEIVGVARDARYDDLKTDSLLMAYHPVAQSDEYLNSIEVNAAGTPAALASAVRAALTEVEPRLPVLTIETLDERVVRSMGQEHILTLFTMAFGGVALFLACLGLYGTISYAVTRRTAEMGVRMALGADRGTVMWLIMREALGLVGSGLVLGLPLAYLGARAMTSVLYGINPSDFAAHGVGVATLVVVALLAAYIPARRASRVDPMMALRAE